eukprot:1866894-Pleurochrysis_carterae.AAC.5
MAAVVGAAAASTAVSRKIAPYSVGGGEDGGFSGGNESGNVLLLPCCFKAPSNSRQADLFRYDAAWRINY